MVVPAGVSQRRRLNTWGVDPEVVLEPGTRYVVTLVGGPTAIRDLAGNPLETTTWRFKTGR